MILGLDTFRWVTLCKLVSVVVNCEKAAMVCSPGILGVEYLDLQPTLGSRDIPHEPQKGEDLFPGRTIFHKDLGLDSTCWRFTL